MRTEAVGATASVVAVMPEVRTALLAFQRDFRGQLPGAVLDGRDIGTVVCPDADVKLFSPPRPKSGQTPPEPNSNPMAPMWPLKWYWQDIRMRDERDRTRAVAPLLPAADATID